MTADKATHLAVECGWCNSTVSAVVVGSMGYSDEEQSLISLARCPACGAPIVTMQDLEFYGEYEVGPPRRVWPVPPRTLSWSAPASIRNDFAEACRCFDTRSHTAAALVARRVLEAITLHLGASKNKDLNSRLFELKDSGLIDERLYAWADALRIVGNEAAHDVHQSVSKEDAEDMLVFAEALADYVFTFRQRFDEFTKRRAS